MDNNIYEERVEYQTNTPERETQMMRQMALLDETIVKLEDNIAILVKRLVPVMNGGGISGANSAGVEQKEEQLPPLLQQIATKRKKLNTLADAIRETERRLEL